MSYDISINSDDFSISVSANNSKIPMILTMIDVFGDSFCNLLSVSKIRDFSRGVCSRRRDVAARGGQGVAAYEAVDSVVARYCCLIMKNKSYLPYGYFT